MFFQRPVAPIIRICRSYEQPPLVHLWIARRAAVTAGIQPQQHTRHARSIQTTAARSTVIRKISQALAKARPQIRSQDPKPGVADLRLRGRNAAKSPASEKHRNVKRSDRDSRHTPAATIFDEMDDYQSADQMQAMPKVFGNIEQPADAQIGKFAVFGAANAGKSTLVNRLTGEDVSIVSPRPQTTRTRILAAATEGSRQMVFLDTPGVVSRQGLRRVERNVVTSPWLTLGEADLIIILLDAYKLTQKTEEVEKYIFRNLGHRTDVPAVLVINKIDLVEDHEALAAKVADYKQAYPNIVKGPIYISALGNVNVDELRVFLQSKVRPGDWEVPAGVSSDMSTLMRVEELIRAQWFARLTGYLPYVVRQQNVVWKYAEVPKWQEMMQDGPGHAVEPRDAERDADGNTGMQQELYIEQQLIVPSEGVAKILLGTGGQKIKDIGRDARLGIAKALGHPVRLHLQVTVEKDTTHRK